jgi:hypothetical protein
MRLCKSLGVILIAVSLVMSCGLAVGCEPSISTSTTEPETTLPEGVQEPRYVPTSPPVEYECPKPHGLYSATTLVGKETGEFENDKFTRFNPAMGKFVYKYRIFDGCNKIELTDVVTGEVKVYDFKYSEEDGFITIGGWSTYWKE